MLSGLGVIEKLVTALIAGDDNLLEKIIEKKLESLGEEALMQLVGGPLAVVGRVGAALETGGGSEFNRLRGQFLSGMMPSTHLPGLGGKLLSKLQSAYSQAGRDVTHRAGTVWGRSDWAGSRKDWLDNRWRHDWRSQPRDTRGRWVPGRLDYIAAQLQYRGTKPGRTVRSFRRKRRARRAAARKLARSMIGGG